MRKIIILACLLLLASLIIPVLVGCEEDHSGSNYSPSIEETKPEESVTEAEQRGDENGIEAGSEAFSEDPENYSSDVEPPDDHGGYETEEAQQAYDDAWRGGYEAGIEQAIDEAVQRDQQEGVDTESGATE